MLTSHPVHLFPKETLPTEPKKGAPAPPPKRVGPTRPLFPNPLEMVLTASQLLSPSPFCPVSDFSSSRPSPSWSQAPPSSLSPTQQRHKRNSWAGPSSPGHGSLGPGWVQSSPPSPSVQERSPACDALPASVPAAIRSQPLVPHLLPASNPPLRILFISEDGHHWKTQTPGPLMEWSSPVHRDLRAALSVHTVLPAGPSPLCRARS